LRKLTNFGAWIMVTALVGPLMVFTDRFVIGVMQDAAAVAAYAIPFQIASRTLLVPVAVTQALFPRFAAEGHGASAERCRQFIAFIGLLFTPIIVGLICLAAPLMALWLGDQLDPRSIPIAHLILAGFWINAIANVPYAFIQARGNPRFTALLHLAELPFYLAVLFGLGHAFGLPGFAAAFCLRCAVDCFALVHRAGASRTWLQLLAPMALVFAALAAGSLLSGWLDLLITAAVLILAALALFVFAMPAAIRARIAELPFMPPLLAKARKGG